MKRKCYTEPGTALTKMQTEIVLVLGYDDLTCKGNTTPIRSYGSPGVQQSLICTPTINISFKPLGVISVKEN